MLFSANPDKQFVVVLTAGLVQTFPNHNAITLFDKTREEFDIMALPHASSGQLIDVRPLGDKLPASASKAILKTKELEVLRLVLPAGKMFPEHHVPGEVTLQCLEGAVELIAHGSTQIMRAGEMVYLRGGETHALRAIEDSSVLHTILLKHENDDPNAPLRGN